MWRNAGFIECVPWFIGVVILPIRELNECSDVPTVGATRFIYPIKTFHPLVKSGHSRCLVNYVLHSQLISKYKKQRLTCWFFAYFITFNVATLSCMLCHFLTFAGVTFKTNSMEATATNGLDNIVIRRAVTFAQSNPFVQALDILLSYHEPCIEMVAN